MLGKVKLTLRLSGAAFDDEVRGLIAAAKADLRLVGIVFEDPPESVTGTVTNNGGDPLPEDATGDPLIERAIILYCKAHFGFNPDAKRFEEAYLYQKRALVLAGDYNAME